MFSSKIWVTNAVKAINSEKKLFSLEFNWITVLIISSFYVYGYLGYGSSKISNSFSHLQLVPVLYIFILFLNYFWISAKFKSFNDKLAFTRSDFYLAIIFFCILVITTVPYLDEYLTYDEVSYAGSALQNPQRILQLFEVFPENFQVNKALHGISFLILLTNIAFVKTITKKAVRTQLIVIALSTIGLSLILGFFGGDQLAYSKLNSLPYAFVSALLGITPIVFRLTTTIMISIVLAMCCKFLANTLNLSKLSLGFLALIFITIPIELTFSFTLDHSIFFFAFAIIPLLEVFFRERINPYRWVPFLSVGVFFRASVIIILVVYLFHVVKVNNYKPKILARYAYPLLFLVPYIYGLVVSPIASKNNRVALDLLNLPNDIFNSLKISFGVLPSLFAIFVLGIVIVFNRNKLAILSLYLLLSTFFYYIYLSPELVGTQKYQQEWFSPLIFIGLVYLAIFQHHYYRLRNRAILIMSFLLICFYNLHVFSSVPQKNSFLKSHPRPVASYVNEFSNNSFAISFHPYPYNQAFDYLNKSKNYSRCFNSGVVYNLLPEIFAGVTVDDYRFLMHQREKVLRSQNLNLKDWTSISSNDLKVADVQCVILGSITDKSKVVEDLSSKGWVVDKVFHHDLFPTSVIIMQKSQ